MDNMLEGQLSEALARNNIKLIIQWLETLSKQGDAETLEIFSCWAQRTSEFAKKELLTLCFSRCQGLWMFLDRNAFTRVHMLLQKLRNLLTLALWTRKHQYQVRLWHGVGVPCAICSNTKSSSNVRLGCWHQEHRTLNQYIWLGRLVQWWGIMGLLPKFPEPQEMKRISQMWKEMNLSHRKALPKTQGWEDDEMGKLNFLIEGIVLQICKEHGHIWTSEDPKHNIYPPPSLQALLKLVLVPHTDNMSVQAIHMYFILDVANFLQCKDNLLQSFCHAFTIPPNFSQQIRAFWLFDHGHVKASMDLLLSPKATAPLLSWQHRCIIHSLLTKKLNHMALRYLHWTNPAIEKIEDANLYADVLLQSSCVSEAWTLLKKSHTVRENVPMHFFQACKEFDLFEDAMKYTPEEFNGKRGFDDKLQIKKKELPVCPLSAKLYQHQRERTLSSKEVIKLVNKSILEVKQSQTSLGEIVWPTLSEKKSNSILVKSSLSCLTPNTSSEDTSSGKDETPHTDDQEDEHVITNEQTEINEQISSSENESSASSFTSASSYPLQKHPYVYKSTVTLQRISSLITDGENQSGAEEVDGEESRTSSPADSQPECCELVFPLEGSTESVFEEQCSVDLKLSAEGDKGKIEGKTGQKEEDFSAAANVGTVCSAPIGKDEQSNQCTVSDCILEIKVNLKEFDSHQQDPVQFPHQDLSNLSFKETRGDSLSHSSAHNAKVMSKPYITDSFSKNPEELHNLGTSLRPDHCTAGSWTHNKESREYSDLLSTPEPGNKTSLGFHDQSYAYGLVSFMDFVSKQKDDKQAEKQEPEGWSGKAPQQGATRSGRLRTIKGKRMKRT